MARKNENKEVSQEIVNNLLELPNKKFVLFNSSTVQGGKSLIVHYFIYGYLKTHGVLPAIIDLDFRNRSIADTYSEAKTLNIENVESVFDLTDEAQEPVIVVDCPTGSTPQILNAVSPKKKSSLSSYLDFFDIFKHELQATPIWFAVLDNDIVKSMKNLEELDEAFSQIAEQIPGFKLNIVMVYNKGHWKCDKVYDGINGLTSIYITNPPQVLTNFINKPYFNVIFQEINQNITSFAKELKTYNLSEITGKNIIAKQKIRQARASAKEFYLSIYNDLLK